MMGPVARALLLENPHSNADSALEAAGLTVTRHAAAMSEDELIDALHDVAVLGIRSQSQVTARVLDAHPELEAIGAFCIGTNQIDLAAASRLGVAVFNAPFSNTRSVVELAVSEIIALTRRLTERDRALHDGTWDKSAMGSHEVRGRTLGIIGYGNIGTQLSVVAEALGMRVIFFDIAEKLSLGNARRMSSLDALLAEADIVSLHCPRDASTLGLMDAAAFAAMKPGAIFVSTARGGIHDEAALHAALASGHLTGAGLDVWDQEPPPASHPLLALPQVVAIGECGLDYNRDFSPRPVQDAVFDAQLALAAELGMPVFLHCRDAHARFIEILRPWLPSLPGAVLHCFTGSDQELDQCLALGLHIGVTGWLCDERRGQLLREQVARIPAGRLMIETDAPYLVPRDLKPRPKRNEPAFLPHIAQVVAACRGEAPEALLAHTRATSAAFFQLPLLE